MLLIKNQTFLSSGSFDIEIITRQSVEKLELPKTMVVTKGYGSKWPVARAKNFRKVEVGNEIQIICDVDIREADYKNYVKLGYTALVGAYVVGSKGTGSYNRQIVKRYKSIVELFLTSNPVSKQSLILKENVHAKN